MKTVCTFFAVGLIFLCCTATLLAQSPEKSLENIKENYQFEKIFVHYDKAMYTAGETIWFKAYVMEGIYPSSMSSTIYLTLTNDSGRVIAKKILPIIAGSAVGEFTLNKDLPQGNYHVLAYTMRLLNFGAAFFYTHQFAVFNPNKPLVALNAEAVPYLNFFPEGGNFVAGVKNSVAFKATDQFGNPVNVKGELQNSAKEIFTSFTSDHDGMGKFFFTPLPGDSYKAIVTFNNSSASYTLDLPALQISGSILQIAQRDTNIYFAINNEKIASEAMRPAYLLGVMNNEVVLKTVLAAKQEVTGRFSSSKLPSGILQLTVFTQTNQPLCERMLFINNNDFSVTGKFVTDSFSSSRRGKNSFSYIVDDTTLGTFSASVVDADNDLDLSLRSSIAGSLLLSEEIKGRLHNPGYYFDVSNANRKTALDLVMLTSGWRRYNWTQVLNQQLPTMRFKNEQYISLQGEAKELPGNKLLKNAALTGILTLKDSTTELLSFNTNDSGRFEINGLIFQDSAMFTYRNKETKTGATLLRLSSPSLTGWNTFKAQNFLRQPTTFPLITDAMLDKIKGNYVFNLNNTDASIKLLSNVQLTAVKQKNQIGRMDDRYVRNTLFAGGTKTVDLINEPLKTNLNANLFDYLKSRIAGVYVGGSYPNYTLNYRQTFSLSSGELLPMAFFVDEQQIDPSQAINIRMADVALIKVFSTGFPGAVGNGSGGALAIYTKRGDDVNSGVVLTGMNMMKIEGYSPVKEFYIPNYQTEMPAAADLRTTLLWSPYLLTDKENRTLKLPFYNSDKGKRFKVVIVGFSQDGKMLHFEKIVQ